MRLSTAISKARHLPWKMLFRRLRHELPSMIARPLRRSADKRVQTTLPQLPDIDELLVCILKKQPITQQLNPSALYYYLRHEFNLLGSGRVKIKHGMTCQGFCGQVYESGSDITIDPEGKWLHDRINKANLPESIHLWKLVDPHYTPIDWQLDFRSGYRWSESVWYKDLDYGHCPGVDVKVPWELSRMQHLPQLALGAYSSVIPDQDKKRFACEFRNMVLDFLANNPPRFGVNWICTMDIAIRAANWVLAYDLFRLSGLQFDATFMQILTRALIEHGRHIVTHLEWRPDFRANHYLADICGLLWIASALPSSQETDEWLQFSIQELNEEILHQFHAEGSNVEGSACYHRLSSEMVVYALARILSLPEERLKTPQSVKPELLKTNPPLRPNAISWHEGFPVSKEALLRVSRIPEFTNALTHVNGNVAQIGDNDNGRFFQLYAAETINQLDHRHLIHAFDTLFDSNEIPETSSLEHSTDAIVIRALSAGKTLPPITREPVQTLTRTDTKEIDLWKKRLSTCTSTQHYTIALPTESELSGFRAYPEFGMYSLRGKENRWSLIIRCGPLGLYDLGGHSHHDQLSITLCIDDKDLIRDAGTYTYTASMQQRNAYRSVRAHCAPWLNEPKEPGNSNLGPFLLGNEAKAECLSILPYGFVGRHYGYGAAVYRVITIHKKVLKIIDAADAPLTLFRLPIDDTGNFTSPIPYSPGYGSQI